MGICSSCNGLGTRGMQRTAYASQGSYMMMTYDSCHLCRGSGRTPDYHQKCSVVGHSDALIAILSILAGAFVCFQLSQLEIYTEFTLAGKLLAQAGAFFVTLTAAGTFLALPAVRKGIKWTTIVFLGGVIVSCFLFYP